MDFYTELNNSSAYAAWVKEKKKDTGLQSNLIFSSVADMDGKLDFILLKVSNFFNNPDTYRDNKFTSSIW